MINLRRILVQVWPTIYRIINNTFYFIISVIKSIFKLAMDEIKGN